MKTLIVPCAGKSSRFKNMRPKYLLTHPDGEIMVKKAISGINIDDFDRVIITIVKAHDEQYESEVILNQAFSIKNQSKIELCILPEFTSCQSETVYKTIISKNIDGEIVIKDSDNYLRIPETPSGNFIVGLDISKFGKEVNRLRSKSFLIINNQNIITDIIEKKIKSEHICLGMYGFADAKQFLNAFIELSNYKIQNELNEIFISHVVSYLIGSKNIIFKYCETSQFEDWGTLQDWQIVQKSMRTYFVDLDGIIFVNRGRYGSKNWSNDNTPIQENVRLFKEIYENGGQIVITTSRGPEYEMFIRNFFKENGINLHAVITGCNHAGRVIINDFAPSNSYPSCLSISVPRDSKLGDYIKQ